MTKQIKWSDRVLQLKSIYCCRVCDFVAFSSYRWRLGFCTKILRVRAKLINFFISENDLCLTQLYTKVSLWSTLHYIFFINDKLVVPSVAWDFFFDKHINLTYRDGVVFWITFFQNYQVILLNLSPNLSYFTKTHQT